MENLIKETKTKKQNSHPNKTNSKISTETYIIPKPDVSTAKFKRPQMTAQTVIPIKLSITINEENIFHDNVKFKLYLCTYPVSQKVL